MSVQIFTLTHKPFTPPPDPLYIPLQVGRSGAENLGFPGDDTGDEISRLNPYFCELTGMYWIWKNYRTPGAVGVCHYRRYLLNEDGGLFTEKQLIPLLEKYDMITTKLLTLPCSYEQGFGADHHKRDLDTTRAVLVEKYPEYVKTFDRLARGTHTYFGNIFIASKRLYDSYCVWLFDLLFEVYARTDLTGYTGYQKRLFGFLAEFLQTVWIRHNGLSVCECMVGMVGEKYETRQLKEQLAAFFAKRDYAAAESCFWDCYRKRPDVLMEASDVTGELRLCMQIISTSRFEDEAYGRCILDSLRDYRSLIRHFHFLNTAVSHFINGQTDKEDLAFLKQSPLITPIAVSISVRLFCPECSVQEMCGRLDRLRKEH
ncbi:MAG: DUF4422 domain-containing protein [Lachnospiraceae bacterium]|nr:DUF4422 domain-containing protein [Lachnospiraceae bacterium]